MTEERQNTSRAETLKVACPVCGAVEGEPCRRDDVPSHRDRHDAAIAAGSPHYERKEGKFVLVP